MVIFVKKRFNVVQNSNSHSLPQSGMNRDKHPSMLSDSEYSFAMNACIENDTGDMMMVQNEPSNILCSKLEGYKVVGYKNDLSDGYTWFFLSNPSNNTSKIVFLKSVDYIAGKGDAVGLDISEFVNLSEPLSRQAGRYTEICDAFQILIEDDASDPCLNFSLSHPIYTIEIKQEKCGKCIYWTDDFNPPRYVIVDLALNPDDDGDIWYHYHGYKICGDNTPIERCTIACEKLRVFPLLELPVIKPEVIEFGGNLRSGVYQFAVALCDEFGNEKTDYVCLSNPIPIFDKQDITVKDGMWGKVTNLGIRLTVSNLDRQVNYFKVAVIQNTVGFNGEPQPVNDFLIEGIHPITESSVYYYTDVNCKRTTLEHILSKRAVYNTSEGITSVGNRLLQYGLTAETEWNLQPVCNFLGHFLRWQSSVSTENLYKDGAACSLYAGFMRDEVYPFGISFETKTGYITPIFTLIPRPKKKEEAELIDDSDIEFRSINENAPICSEIERVEKWQYRNTATSDSRFISTFAEEICENEVKIPQTFVYEHAFGPVGSSLDLFEDVWFRFEPETLNQDAVDYLESNIEKVVNESRKWGGKYEETANEIKTAWDSEKGDTKFPDSIAIPENCLEPVLDSSGKQLSAPKEYFENPMVVNIYKELKEMDHVRTSGLETSRAEADNKKEYLFDIDLIDEFQECIEDVYENGEDTTLIDNRPADKLVGISSDRRKLYLLSECLYGCSIKIPVTNPVVSEEKISGLSFQRLPIKSMSVICERTDSGSSSSTLMKNLKRDTDRIFDQIKDTEIKGYYEGFALTYEGFNYEIKNFDTRIETDWKERNFDQNEVEFSIPDSNFRFDSQKSRFKFAPKLHMDTRWVQIDKPTLWNEPSTHVNEKRIILEILGNSNISLGDSSSYDWVRLSFWYEMKNERNQTDYGRYEIPLGENGNPLGIKSEDLGKYTKSDNSIIVRYRDRFFVGLTESSFRLKNGDSITKILIAVDTPICVMDSYILERKGDRAHGLRASFFSITTAITPSSYGVGVRDKEIKFIDLRADSIKLVSTATFVSDCVSCGEKMIDCAPRYHDQGGFGYWESSEKYPANFELFDSSKVKFNTSDDKYSEIVSKLSEYYGAPKTDKEGLGYFDGNTAEYPEADTVFCQKKIRHYKFPDNFISPFMNEDIKAPEDNSNIYVLGVLLDDSKVNLFLDIAVESGLITKEQRDNVYSYTIYRGDRALNRGVIANGLAYDMWKYVDRSGRLNIYSNYPYNDLYKDEFIYSDSKRSELMDYPFGSKGNCWYTFYSPDLYFNKPDLPSEIKIEGYQRGYSNGVFTLVENHPKWCVLGPKAYHMAKTLATIEAAAQLAIEIADATYQAAQQMYVGAGMVFIANPAGIAMTTVKMIAAIAKATSRSFVNRGKYRYEWLNTYMDRGPRRNYAYYYTSEGKYNNMYIPTDAQRKGNSLRGASTVKYIKNGNYAITDSSIKYFNKPGSKYGVKSDVIVINNFKRESCMFFSFGYDGKGDDLYRIKYPQSISGYDKSRVTDPCLSANDSIAGKTIDLQKQTSPIASPYMKIKKYIPNQYGRIEDIKWISTGINDEYEPGTMNRLIFGGDTYISRFSLKRKFPMFTEDAFGIGDMIPFPYNDSRNVAFPKYFVNFDTGEEALDVTDSESGQLIQFPTRKSVFKLNDADGDMYVYGRFYLYFYGIPQFLVESETNCNFRLEGQEYHEKFYPEVGDYIQWTQEKNVSIVRDNDFRISNVYGRRNSMSRMILPSTYEKRQWDCAYQRPNGVIWSIEDVSENSKSDPWLTYKPMDYFEFPAKYGKLIHMKGIESGQVLSRFENQVRLDNAIDVLKERIQPGQEELGTGGLFASRGMEFNSTDLGYAGTQSRDIVSNEYGHFWADIKRGQVFQVNPNGQGLKELSNGVKYWLKEHLPIKLLKYNIVNVDTGEAITYRDLDNKFMSLGLSIGWDNRFKRVLLTKKDYIPKKAGAYKFKEGKFYFGDTEISVHDEEYFEDVSFTIGFKVDKGEWLSYYSFIPDYYIEHMYYFQTGLNFDKKSERIGLWSHLLTNKSFQTFYGDEYEFTIEVPVKEQFVNKILASVQYRMESRKYVNEIDYIVHRTVGFNKAWLYNNRDCSGELRLIPGDKNDLYQRLEYPKYYDNYSEVVLDEVDDTWKLADFFNRTKDDMSGNPIWIRDLLDIYRVINPEAMNYDSIWQDRLRGDWMLYRLSNTEETTYKMIVRWMSSSDKIYDA